MRRHESRHARTTAARLLAAGLLTVGTLGACGNAADDDTATAEPKTSAESSSTAPATTAGAATTAGPASTAAGTPDGTLALDGAITLTTPGQDATVGRSFQVRGSGVAFEGTLVWKLARSGGGEAASGYAMAGSTEKQPFQFTVEAPDAGSYTLTVYRESAVDGTAQDTVTRRLTVR